MANAEMLREMVEKGASDMHLTIGNPPFIRVHGDLTPLSEAGRITEQDLKGLLYENSPRSSVKPSRTTGF